MIDSMPYSNIHELNLDWVLAKIKYFESWVQGEAADDIREMIQNIWNNFMLGAVYTEDDETIHFTLSEMTGEESEGNGAFADLLAAIQELQERMTAAESDISSQAIQLVATNASVTSNTNRIQRNYNYIARLSIATLFQNISDIYDEFPDEVDEGAGEDSVYPNTLVYRVDQLEDNQTNVSEITLNLNKVSFNTLGVTPASLVNIYESADNALLNRINDLEARIVELEGGEQG